MGTGTLEAKVDRTALITHMLAELKVASDRWDEVCTTYDKAWGTAFDSYSGILAKIAAVKKQREAALASRLATCIELACVFLPIIGGPAAIALAPITTARAQLLVSTVSKRAQTSWTQFSTSRPVVSQVVKEIGTRSAGVAKDAAAKIQKDIIDKLAPESSSAVVGVPTDPLQAFKDKINLKRGELNTFVSACAAWNARDDWQRELVPVAYDMFLNQPWIKDAPLESETMKMRPSLSQTIEMALWLRWAQHLDEKYWKEIHDWYVKVYNKDNWRDGKQIRAAERYNWVRDAIDFDDLYWHFRRHYPRVWFWFGQMKLIDARARGIGKPEYETIDMYLMITAAKKRGKDILTRLLPEGARADRGLIEELAKP